MLRIFFALLRKTEKGPTRIGRGEVMRERLVGGFLLYKAVIFFNYFIAERFGYFPEGVNVCLHRFESCTAHRLVCLLDSIRREGIVICCVTCFVYKQIWITLRISLMYNIF